MRSTPIAGVDGVFVRARQPLGDEPHDRARFVERPGGAEKNAAHCPVDAIEGKLDPPRALGLPLQEHDEIVGELAQLASIASAVWIGEANRRSAQKSGGGKRGEIDGRSRPLSASSRAIGDGAEPRRDRRPGPQRDVADAPQARPRHVGDGFLVEAERGERQIVKELGERLVAQRLGRGFHARKPRQRSSRARIAGGADERR